MHVEYKRVVWHLFSINQYNKYVQVILMLYARIDSVGKVHVLCVVLLVFESRC